VSGARARESHRRQRVAHELQARLAEILSLRVGDPRLDGVIVSAVETTPDFSLARVFVRGFGDREAGLEALERAAPFIRRCLGQGLRLRRVPELDFRLDESLERAERVEEILRELEAERVDLGELEVSGDEGPPSGDESR
jgi:ribosome-binding factor A